MIRDSRFLNSRVGKWFRSDCGVFERPRFDWLGEKG